MTEIIEGEIVGAPEPEEKFFTVKGVAKFVASSSVKFIVAGAVTTLVPPAETNVQKIKLAVGTYVISGMVAKQAKEYVDYKVDEISEDLRQLMKAIKDIESAAKSETPNP